MIGKRVFKDVEHRAPSTLRPYARNAGTYSKRQIRQIPDGIERFGFTNPVLVGEEDRRRVSVKTVFEALGV